MRYFLLFTFFFTLNMSFGASISTQNSCETIYSEVDEDARIPSDFCDKMEELHRREACGLSRLKLFFRKNINYPEAAAKAEKRGVLNTTITINDQGQVIATDFGNEIGFGFEEEVLRVAKDLPEFIPAKINGKAVCSKIELAIQCKPKKNNIRYKAIEEQVRMYDPECEGIAVIQDRLGCSNVNLYAFFEKNLIYPKEAIDNKVEGKVVARIFFDEKGNITKKEVVSSLGSGCDEEALRLIDLVEKWVPAKLNSKVKPSNKTVKIQFLLP